MTSNDSSPVKTRDPQTQDSTTTSETSETDAGDDSETPRHACPECGGKTLSQDGERVCTECNIVVNDSEVDHGPEWRAFNPQEREEKSRVGAPRTNLQHDFGLSTKIDWRDKDAHGQSLSSEQRSKMNRLRTWNKRSQSADSQDRALKHANGEIQRMASALGLPKNVQETAAIIFRRAHTEGLLPGRSIEAGATASLYAAARKHHTPRPLTKVAEVSRVGEGEIGRCYRYFCRELGLGIDPIDPTTIVSSIVSDLDNATIEIEQRAKLMCKYALDSHVGSGKDPSVLAAGAIYAASLQTNEKITQHTIAEAADVTEVSIRNRYQDLLSLIQTKDFEGDLESGVAEERAYATIEEETGVSPGNQQDEPETPSPPNSPTPSESNDPSDSADSTERQRSSSGVDWSTAQSESRSNSEDGPEKQESQTTNGTESDATESSSQGDTSESKVVTPDKPRETTNSSTNTDELEESANTSESTESNETPDTDSDTDATDKESDLSTDQSSTVTNDNQETTSDTSMTNETDSTALQCKHCSRSNDNEYADLEALNAHIEEEHPGTETFDERPIPLNDIPNLGRNRYRILYQAGYVTPSALQNATVDDLSAVDRIGPKTAEKVLEFVNTEYTETDSMSAEDEVVDEDADENEDKDESEEEGVESTPLVDANDTSEPSDVIPELVDPADKTAEEATEEDEREVEQGGIEISEEKEGESDEVITDVLESDRDEPVDSDDLPKPSSELSEATDQANGSNNNSPYPNNTESKQEAAAAHAETVGITDTDERKPPESPVDSTEVQEQGSQSEFSDENEDKDFNADGESMTRLKVHSKITNGAEELGFESQTGAAAHALVTPVVSDLDTTPKPAAVAAGLLYAALEHTTDTATQLDVASHWDLNPNAITAHMATYREHATTLLN